MKLADITSAPPLKHLSKGAADAIADVQALAQKQSEATEAAVQTSPAVPYGAGVSLSFSFNPHLGTLDFSSSNPLKVEAERVGAQFSISIRL